MPTTLGAMEFHGGGGLKSQNFLKSIKSNFNFVRGGVQTKEPTGRVWIFSCTVRCNFCATLSCPFQFWS